MDPKDNEVVDDLLDTIDQPTIRNVVFDNKPLAEAIVYFLKLKAAGDPRAHVTLAWFYREKLREKFNGPKSFDTVRTYVRTCLGLDMTGAPIG